MPLHEVKQISARQGTSKRDNYPLAGGILGGGEGGLQGFGMGGGGAWAGLHALRAQGQQVGLPSHVDECGLGELLQCCWYRSQLWLTPRGIIHQDFKQIPCTTTEFTFWPISRMLACYSLLACLLAQASRSTIDPKKGYKTKIGFISSLTLITTEYWTELVGRDHEGH